MPRKTTAPEPIPSPLVAQLPALVLLHFQIDAAGHFSSPRVPPQDLRPRIVPKVMSLREAVERFLEDGMTVALSCSLEPLVPFAAGHEIIRQGRRDLELVAPISDSLFDQLIGAGCARRVTAAWVGNVSEKEPSTL